MATDESTELRPASALADCGGHRTPADLGADAVSLTAELVRIDSVNPGLVPGSAGEGAIVEHLRERLRRNGFETHVVTPPGHPERPSLVAVGPGDPTGTGRPTRPTIVLTGHVDTVGVEGMADPFVARVEDDRLAGRGASDMKGGVAAMVVAAEELVRRGGPARVVLALVADEEDASHGTDVVLAALPELGVRPDVALVGEPTWLALAETLRGFAVVKVTLAGRPAHSSQPELGVNAVAHLGRLLVAVEERGRRIAAGGGSMLACVANGGESTFVLARTATAVIERRTMPGESAEAALAEVGELIDGLRVEDPTLDATAELVMAREAWQLDDAGPAATLAARLEAVLGESASGEGEPGDGVPGEVGTRDGAPEGVVKAGRFHAPYWMEAPLWQAAGIPAIVCGPAGGGLHAADEWVSTRQVRRFSVALVDAVTTWAEGHAD